MEETKEFWNSEKANKVFEIANPEQKTLQPFLAKLIMSFIPETVLDYGCGDSFVSRLLNPAIKLGLYDTNVNSAKNAAGFLKNRNCLVFEKVEELPKDYYDIIVFSLVLICLKGKDEFRFALSQMKKTKKDDGHVVLVTTHPCFRQYDYRPFYADYATGRQFHYLNEFEPFEVTIRDDEKEGIRFVDYHWPLDLTINEIINNGFSITRVVEVPDATYDNIPANRFFPPFLIIIFK